MTMFLLIIITVMLLATMICSIISTIVIVKENKAKDLVKKILRIVSIIFVIILVISLAFGVSIVKKDNNSNTKNNNSTNTIALEDAGFNEITLDEYLNLIKSSEKKVILVARPTCYYCEQFTPILKQASEELGVTVNYINTDEFSDDNWTTFNSSLDYLNSKEWGTPLTLIVQNGKVIDDNNGYVELDGIKKFFTDNGFGE